MFRPTIKVLEAVFPTASCKLFNFLFRTHCAWVSLFSSVVAEGIKSKNVGQTVCRTKSCRTERSCLRLGG